MVLDDYPTDEYARRLYSAAKHIALDMDMALPELLIIAEWPGLTTTCNDPGATGTALRRLLAYGTDCLIQRGLIANLDN